MSEDKGAFELGDKLKLSRDSFMTLETETKTAIANAAYAAGRKAGRASREGLREGLELVLRYMEKRGGCSCIDGSCPVCFAQKALEADGEGR